MAAERGGNMKPKSSRLFSYSILDMKDDIDERLEHCQKSLAGVTSVLREAELYEQLNVKVCRSQQDHDETVLALLYLILIDPNEAHKWYSTLAMVTRDSMSIILQITEILILEKLPRLLETTRVQLMWLAREMVHTGVNGADRLCFAFLKQMPSGSNTPQDVWLAENLLHLFLDNRQWVESQPHLVASIVYTYLSLIPFHVSLPSLSQLKDNEIQLVISLLRNKFQDCLQIGRDLLRLLQNLSRVPEFSDLWFDILNNPVKLAPNFTGVHQLLSKRTSRRFIAGRIVTDAEIKLNFLLSKVKFGQHKRYQEWFIGKYLSKPESLHMIPELVRFVCCVIHPSNEVLGSDVMPRWALIGWLLSMCQANQVIFMNAKLSLFYDWLVYSPGNENIMNIEPAALLMFNSLRSHPQITASLLDFICRLVPSYCPPLESQIRDGFSTAFADIANKGVLPSVDCILCSIKLDEDLRTQIKTLFPEVCPDKSPVQRPDAPTESEPDVLVIADEVIDISEEDQEISDAFSDKQEENDDEDDINPWSNVENLPAILREKLESLRAKSDSLEMLKDLLVNVQEANYNREVIELLSPPLLHCISSDFETLCNQDEIEVRPFYCLLSHIADGSIEMLAIMRSINQKLGYYTLFYCYRISSYGVYVKSIGRDRNVRQALCEDLKVCAVEDSSLFFSLLSPLCNEFSKELIGCCNLMSIITSNIDPQQLNELIIDLTLKRLVLFGKQAQEIIINSLEWDSFEQFCLWQLLCAEGPEAHHIVSVLKQISPSEHPEAISGIILLLKQEPSIPGAVGNLLSLPVQVYGEIVSAVVSRWINNKPSKMAKFIDYCFGKVQKLSEPLPTFVAMFENLDSIVTYLVNTDIMKVCDMQLSSSIIRLFDAYPALKSRFGDLHSKVTLIKDQHPTSTKRRKSSDSDEIIRTKRKRVTAIEDLSD